MVVEASIGCIDAARQLPSAGQGQSTATAHCTTSPPLVPNQDCKSALVSSASAVACSVCSIGGSGMEHSGGGSDVSCTKAKSANGMMMFHRHYGNRNGPPPLKPDELSPARNTVVSVARDPGYVVAGQTRFPDDISDFGCPHHPSSVGCTKFPC
ncbi:hypothetical protein K437DRAFT_257421 [Tilletiaria anomala UBC 951]|uniref:Uncharacterized protein n=1 Tax=Tilletiaria anomala (strain ATCC 24038 / CBS 436.72 / UBC 951) TaxID=1037660 RepID=A0A066VTS3_TILAU|nr:uncharacterized protein K437DRAFT_257421 [Tilletiaria anomala UBC 951]KDN43688.1 hypothetical protein K437DRAFT_257421 [Tilletiaria anomala UBC 951]